mmetsp:Transcript_37981/g.83385  ORF Transcript_37981/g.83385 Transcript_37981/m.83385 type:complete len:264 (+) Transcript_37981:631-1422(+)
MGALALGTLVASALKEGETHPCLVGFAGQLSSTGGPFAGLLILACTSTITCCPLLPLLTLVRVDRLPLLRGVVGGVVVALAAAAAATAAGISGSRTPLLRGRRCWRSTVGLLVLGGAARLLGCSSRGRGASQLCGTNRLDLQLIRICRRRRGHILLRATWNPVRLLILLGRFSLALLIFDLVDQVPGPFHLVEMEKVPLHKLGEGVLAQWRREVSRNPFSVAMLLPGSSPLLVHREAPTYKLLEEVLVLPIDGPAFQSRSQGF